LRDRSNVSYNYWLIDRSNHGLLNTVTQYRELDSFLTELYPQWYLIKFIYGDVSATGEVYGGEWEMYRYGLPLAFKAFGIPYGVPRDTFLPGLSINPSNLIYAGAPTVEWSVVLPDYVVNNLKTNFTNIVIGYGNYFGLFSCKDGITKDSSEVNEIFQLIRDKEVYLWRK